MLSGLWGYLKNKYRPNAIKLPGKNSAINMATVEVSFKLIKLKNKIARINSRKNPKSNEDIFIPSYIYLPSNIRTRS